MKVMINENGCIGCSVCVGICPSVFEMSDDGYAVVYSQPEDGDKEAVLDAIDNCPVSVISIEEQ